MLGLALVAHVVLIWPAAPGVEVADAEKRVVAAGHRAVAFAPLGERLAADAEAARARETEALGRVEARLKEARAQYVGQRFDDMARTLELALDEGKTALGGASGCSALWEVAFQLGLAHAGRRDPDAAKASARFWALALALDEGRRPDRALYGPKVVQAFTSAVDAEGQRAARPIRLKIEPSDAQVMIDCKPVVETARPVSLRPGLHAVRASAPGFAPAATIAEVDANAPLSFGLAEESGEGLAVVWTEGTLSASSPSARRAMLAAAAKLGATHVLLVSAEVTRVLFSAAGVEPLEKQAPVESPLAPVKKGKSVLTRWWFWASVGVAVATAVVVGVVVSEGKDQIEVGVYPR